MIFIQTTTARKTLKLEMQIMHVVYLIEINYNVLSKEFAFSKLIIFQICLFEKNICKQTVVHYLLTNLNCNLCNQIYFHIFLFPPKLISL